MRIVIIGAGIVGASIAARLARREATVTVVDHQAPGSGTTSTSYAWVNANGKEPESYFELNMAGLEAHHKLAAEGGQWLHPHGHVEIAVDEAHQAHLHARIERLSSRGYEVEIISVEHARKLLLDVAVPDDARTIAFFPREAHVFPLIYLAHMMAEARAAGATIRQAKVVGLTSRGHGAEVGLDDGTVLQADVVVSAVGRWTSDLTTLAGSTVPMAGFSEPGDVTVGYLLETDPLPVRLDRLLTSPWLNVRPDGGGRLLIQALDLDATADPDEVPGHDSALAQTYLERLRVVVPNAASATIRRLVVGQRAMPADGHTVVGPLPDVPWLYVVATHSGVTLAPFLGDAVAAEIFGEEESRFIDFRPTRFTGDGAFLPPSAPRRPGEQ